MFDQGGYQLDLSAFDDEVRVVSTGRLPISDTVRAGIEDAYSRYHLVRDGAVPSCYPALAQVDPDLFGIAVAATSGEIFAVGDVDTTFTIMSIAQPFVLAIVLDRIGPQEVRRLVGVNATGFPFNSVIPADGSGNGLNNPMVNTGALAITSLVPGGNAEEKWEVIAKCLAQFAGRRLTLDEPVFASASSSNHRNRALANLLLSAGRLYSDPTETVDLYTRQSSLSVTAIDLAVVGSTLAHGGLNPLTGEGVVSATVCRRVLAVMAAAGLYESSGGMALRCGSTGKERRRRRDRYGFSRQRRFSHVCSTVGRNRKQRSRAAGGPISGPAPGS